MDKLKSTIRIESFVELLDEDGRVLKRYDAKPKNIEDDLL